MLPKATLRIRQCIGSNRSFFHLPSTERINLREAILEMRKTTLMLFGFVAFALVASINALCTSPRIRKAWQAMSETEKRLYKEAVALAMDSGKYSMFSEIHLERKTNSEAHGNCAFLFWHRRFVLAYENMLRDMGAAYECVTVPYYNYFADYIKYQAGQCNSLLSCSTILQELGGNSGEYKKVKINGRNLSGYCSSEFPLDHFCENSLDTKQCIGCLPRGEWSSSKFPTSVGYSFIASILTQAKGFADFARNVESTPHNVMHNILGSIMGTFSSPSDPIFFSHHASIDMLHSVFYRCHISKTLDDSVKKTNKWAYQKCGWGKRPISNSNFMMRWAHVDTSEVTHADAHAKLAKYFDGVGDTYYQFVDHEDMGEHSYAYEVDDFMANLEQNGLVCSPKIPHGLNDLQETLHNNTVRQTVAVQTEARYEIKAMQEKSIQLFESAYNSIRKRLSDPKAITLQLEIMECMYHNEYLAPVQDYNAEFRKNFKISNNEYPRCYDLLQKVKNKKISFMVHNWENLYKNYFPNAKKLSKST